jgi:prepilin-type N-terminal cleavage/methylation domain-containing protein
MSKQENKLNYEGFTIIEVLIVLAIAALILLVVFLAVPNLQRSQRNSGRKAEAERFSANITDFVGNNQGALPLTTSDITSIQNNFGTFGYIFKALASGPGVTTIPALSSCVIAQGKITLCVAGANLGSLGSISADAILVADGAKCGSSSIAMTLTAGSVTNIAVVYTTESVGGVYNQVCIQSQ